MNGPSADTVLDELIEEAKRRGGNYRPPKRQGFYWDVVDALELLRESSSNPGENKHG